jgi:hypothetical protein
METTGEAKDGQETEAPTGNDGTQTLDRGAAVPEDFDWRYYLSAYPDLQRNGVVGESDARLHYAMNGHRERRNVRDPRTGVDEPPGRIVDREGGSEVETETEAEGEGTRTLSRFVPWFMCLNGSSPRYEAMALTALASSVGMRGVDRYCIYDGGNEEFVAAARGLGCEVIRHRSSLYDEMERVFSPAMLSIGSGAYLRLDIPAILKRLNKRYSHYLYTDVDVMLVSDPFPALSCNRTSKFAASSEFRCGPGETYFNSGSMWCNVDFMTRTYEGLRAYAIAGKFNFVAFDQGALNEFYRGCGHQFLDTWFNWKPYWGIGPKARILHFHGPKPDHVARYLGGEEPILDYSFMYHPGTKDSYVHYLRIWRGFASSIGVRLAEA